MNVDTQLIDGRAHAAQIRSQINELLPGLDGKPGLAVVLVGADPASQVYVNSKQTAAKEVGIFSIIRRLPEDISQDALLAEIDSLNRDDDVHGILIQLPLPDHIDPRAVIGAVAPEKDVDGFHALNVGQLGVGSASMVPCTPLGCLHLLKQSHRSLSGLRAVVVGRSNIVGKPVAQLLLAENCTVVMAHSRTRELNEECHRADILIAAVGRPNLIRGEWLKLGATVIDVGINRIETDSGAKLVGDVAFDEAIGVAGAITPVPGGVGPMTIAFLLVNTVRAFAKQHTHVRLPSSFSSLGGI